VPGRSVIGATTGRVRFGRSAGILNPTLKRLPPVSPAPSSRSSLHPTLAFAQALPPSPLSLTTGRGWCPHQVNVNDTRQRFKRFVHNFEKADADAALPFYLNMLQLMIEKEAVAFNLDCHNLHDFDPELYNQLVQYPQEVIPIFDFVVQEEALAVLQSRGMDSDKQERLQVRAHPSRRSKTT
jgi:hypothetical protein